MSAYRFTDPNPTLLNLLGTESSADGSLTFYDKGTTDEKDTFSDQGLTIENANPVELDASGRAETEIWLDGEYTVVLKDADGSTVWTRDVVPEIAPGLAIPDLAGNGGKLLTNDGSSLSWEERLQLPDPTGSAGYQVVVNSDGTDYLLQAIAEIDIPEPEVVVGTSSLRVGQSDDATKGLIQCGTDSAPNSGAFNTSKAVVYPTPYATTPYPFVQPTGGPFTSGNGGGGYYVDWSITSASNTGFTVTFNGNHGEDNNDGKINSTVPFNWFAYGTVEVT